MKFNRQMIDQVAMSIAMTNGDQAIMAIIENTKALTEILDVDKDTVLREMCAEVASAFVDVITTDDLVELVYEQERKMAVVENY